MRPAGRHLRNRPPGLSYLLSFRVTFGTAAGSGAAIQLSDFKYIFTERTNLHPTRLARVLATACPRR
jgi:hypothetical protein